MEAHAKAPLGQLPCGFRAREACAYDCHFCLVQAASTESPHPFFWMHYDAELPLAAPAPPPGFP